MTKPEAVDVVVVQWSAHHFTAKCSHLFNRLLQAGCGLVQYMHRVGVDGHQPNALKSLHDVQRKVFVGLKAHLTVVVIEFQALFQINALTEFRLNGPAQWFRFQ